MFRLFLPVVTQFFFLILVSRRVEGEVEAPSHKTAPKPTGKLPDKVIMLRKINTAATVGAPTMFKVMKDSRMVQSLKLTPEMDKVSVSPRTWENFVGGVYNFELEGDFTILNIAATFFNYDCVYDLKD